VQHAWLAVVERKYPIPDMKILWGRAAALCGFPGCRRSCVRPATPHDRASHVGKIAHIVAHSDTGPRADPSCPASDRDCYENWILLCSIHHDMVDVQPNTYSVSQLRAWKSDLEAWVKDQLCDEMPQITSAELETVCRGIVASPLIGADSGFAVTPPGEKMRRNGLTDRVHFYLTLGLAKAKEVAAFVSEMAQLDSTFPERLRAGFIAQYNSLRSEGSQGDDLFEGMVAFASSGTSELSRRAAGLAVLAYLFELCEVFER
jgi:hypothetical protein